jgi:hypothetical protein
MSEQLYFLVEKPSLRVLAVAPRNEILLYAKLAAFNCPPKETRQWIAPPLEKRSLSKFEKNDLCAMLFHLDVGVGQKGTLEPMDYGVTLEECFKRIQALPVNKTPVKELEALWEEACAASQRHVDRGVGLCDVIAPAAPPKNVAVTKTKTGPRKKLPVQDNVVPVTVAVATKLKQPATPQGIKRPGGGTTTGLVWEQADKIFDTKKGAAAAKKDIKNLKQLVATACIPLEINPNTVNAQFRSWAIFNGLKK